MTYSAMAADVLAFCKKHELEEVSLLGHSMYAHLFITLLSLRLPVA